MRSNSRPANRPGRTAANAPLTTPVNRLPVTATVVAAGRLVWRRRRAFVALAAVPIAATAAIETVLVAARREALPALLATPGDAARSSTDIDRLASAISEVVPFLFATMFAGIFLLVTFAVAWHRLAATGGGAPMALADLVWRARHWRYLARLVAVAALFFTLFVSLVFVVAAVAGTILAVGGAGDTVTLAVVGPLVFATAMMTGAVIVRLALTLPAAAVDASFGFADSWQAT